MLNTLPGREHGIMDKLNIRKELFHRIKRAEDEIKEGMRYGVPHLVGEISTEGDDPKVDIAVVVFKDARHRFLITDSESVKFLFPLEDDSPHRIFMKLWMFLNGKPENNCIKPGITIKGPLYEALRRKRFDVVWTSPQGNDGAGYVQVIVVRDGVRYNMLFEALGDNIFKVADVKEI